jgi:hypothetical protein
MSKIGELIKKYDIFLSFECDENEIVLMMKEYAEWYARKCLEKFEKDSDPAYDMQGYFVGYSTPYLETFKLPEHE